MRLFLASLLLASFGASAQTIVQETSFGYGTPRAPDTRNIPGWKMLGEGHDIELLSDKVILTPPYPGNKRGALWAEHTTALEDWTAEFEFRASGPERPGGNLQLWYASNGEQAIGTSSIYTVGRFDGLAIVIDSHGGGSGSIRGFLNDGTTDYQSRHPAVDSLAFGHCDYAYRNLGRPSVLQIKHGRDNFEVRIDNRLCFSSNLVVLPPSYSFGVTAATSENPDSFEIFKFVVSSGSTSTSFRAPPQQQQQQAAQAPPNTNPSNVPASSITSGEAQFADLHDRLQALNGLINSLFQDFQTQKDVQGVRHSELLQNMPKDQTILALDRRVQSLETMVSSLKKQIEDTDHARQFSKLHDRLTQTHVGITDLPSAFTEGMSKTPSPHPSSLSPTHDQNLPSKLTLL
ncbi:putative lectin family integral membrane [Phaeomoniella chlamydospora]|uniref:Putative lectin family integral membrane n=1 Tax=Phaeomoniella chlamydospora TaxID=158046 RepID=A0A0G2GJ53_PHACM|nr:putative lectin family integral membrane [Phaeomoniella chlamydospora]